MVKKRVVKAKKACALSKKEKCRSFCGCKGKKWEECCGRCRLPC